VKFLDQSKLENGINISQQKVKNEKNRKKRRGFGQTMAREATPKGGWQIKRCS